MKRIISFVLALSMIVSLCHTGKTYAATSIPYYNWKQNDSQWANYTFGSSDRTMAAKGCAITSVAMLVVHSGLRNESNFDPGMLCEWLDTHSGFSGNDIYWDKVGEMVSGFNYDSSKTLSGSAQDKINQLKSWYDSGYHIVVSVKNQGHWVAVRSVTDYAVTMMDPNTTGVDLYTTYAASGSTRAILYRGGSTPSPSPEPVPVNNAPIGNVDSYSVTSGMLHIEGWAVDPDAPKTNLDLHVYIGNENPVSIQTGNVHRSDVPYGNEAFHGFRKDISTSAVGSTRVKVYAIDAQGGNNPLISDFYVDFPSATPEPAPTPIAGSIVHLDSPKSNYTYEGTNNLEISGWMATNSEPGYIMAQIDGYGQENLSFWSSPEEGASYPNHKYFYRFSGVINNANLASYTEYKIQIFSGISDGTLTTTFKTGNRQPVVPPVPNNCIVHVDIPQKDKIYSGHRNIELTGWIASNESPTFIMAEIVGSYQINLDFFDSPEEASAQPNYKYFKRFRGVIEVDRLASYTEYYLKIFSSIPDGTYQMKFSTGNVEPVRYSVSFNANGGMGEPSSITVEQGQSVTVPSLTPTRAGYTFVGWSTSSTATTATYKAGSSITPSSNITLYAVWSGPNKYTVTFNANNGMGAPSAITATYNSSVIIPHTYPERFPYDFLGWSTSNTATTASYKPGDSIKVNGNITLYAVWAEPEELRLSQFGYAGDYDITRIGESKRLKFVPTSTDGYVAETIYHEDDGVYCFLYDSDGNILAKDGGSNDNFRIKHKLTAGETYYYEIRFFDNTKTGSITVYFTTEEIKYTATYDYAYNGGTSATKTSDTFEVGEYVNLTPTATKPGWIFVGWNTDKNATVALGSYKTNADTTLYAIYKKTLTGSFYYANNTLQTTKSVTIYNNATSGTITTPSLSSYSGWTALGWRDDTTASSKEYDNASSITLSSDTKYYGVYSRTLTLSYNANGGSSTPSSQTATQYYNASGNKESKSFTLASAITRPNYNFSGWAKGSATGETYGAGSTISVSDDTTMYANWKQNAYTVAYNFAENGGTSATKTSMTVTSGSKADLGVTATKSGWTFVGWNTDKNATTALSSYTVNGAVTLYAIFKKDISLKFYSGTKDYYDEDLVTLYNKAQSLAYTMPAVKPCGTMSISGWRDDKDAKAAEYRVDSDVKISDSTVFYAVYRESISITADYNDGSGFTSTATTGHHYNICGNYEPVTYTFKEAPVRDGYRFLAWSEKGTDILHKPGETISLTKNTTYYALWVSSSCSIVYDYAYNGGTSATATNKTVNSGSDADLTPTATKSGWTFVGWNTDKDATTALSSYTVNSDVTLYAIYKKTLTGSFYYANNTLQTTKSVTIYNNATSGTITTPGLSSYSGWTTLGWRDDTTASSKEYDNASSITISSDTKYYGVYSRTLTLSYNANGGSSTPSSQTATQYYNAYGTKQSKTFTLAVAITKPDSTFGGWAVNSVSGMSYSAGDSISIADNTTMHAVWTQNLEWTLDESGTLTITGNGPMPEWGSSNRPWYEQKDLIKKVVIGSGITSIGKNAFEWCNYIEAITIPNGVTSIGDRAFYNCVRLKSVTIPQTVTTIAETAFLNCDALTAITVAAGNNQYCSVDGVLFDIDKEVLICYPAKKTDLTEYEIPSTVTKIAQQAFCKNSILTNVVIPETVTTIGDMAFYQSSALAEIYIPQKVTSIGNNVFNMCYHLEKIDVDADNAYYSSQNGVLFDKNKTVLLQYPCKNSATVNYTVPKSVTKISANSFRSCTTINSIIIPESVKTIDSYAFDTCSYLKNVYYCGTAEEWNSITISSGNTPLTSATRQYNYTATVNYTVTYNYSENGGEAATRTSATVESGNNADLTPTATKAGWTFVGWNTDKDAATALSSYTVNNDVILYAIYKKTLTGSFYYADNTLQTTKTVTIYNKATSGSITTPSLSSYSGWTALGWRDDTTVSDKEYSNSDSITISADTDFYGVYSRLLTLSYDANGGSSTPTSQTATQYYNASGNKQSKSFILAPAITKANYDFGGWAQGSIGGSIYSTGSSISISEDTTMYAIWEGNDIASGTCGNDLKWTLDNNGTLIISGSGSMNGYSESSHSPWYSYADDIKFVVLEEGVTTIGSYAFSNCSNLESITIPSGVENIGFYTFEGCSSLLSIALPDELTGIGVGAFSGCEKLESINIPAGVTAIMQSTFADCSGLKNIVLSDSIKSIGNFAFDNCNNLTNVSVPNGITSIKSCTFRNCSSLKSITLPESITSIGGSVFSGCRSLENITIPDSVTEIAFNAFMNCSSLRSIAIPDGIISIQRSVFSDCGSLESVYIPKSVTSIEGYAFSYCSSLKDVYYSGSEAEWSNIEIAGNNNDLLNATIHCNYIPDSVIANGICGEEIIWSLSDNGILTISGSGKMTDFSTTSDIPWYNYRLDIHKIVVSDGITHIGTKAFYGCINLDICELSQSVETIGNSSFKNCDEMVIHGKTYSYAYKYAVENSIPFVSTGRVMQNLSVDFSQTDKRMYFDISIDDYCENAVVYVALYDDNGNMLSITYDNLVYGDITSVSLNKVSQATHAKAFVWGASMDALTKSETIEFN